MNKPIIMCVDDERMMLTSVISQLAHAFGADFSYEGFTSAEEALEFLEELPTEAPEKMPVALIISDWHMPQTKGDEFMVQVHDRWPNIKLIMLSGQAEPKAVQRAFREANMFCFLNKPWERGVLVTEVAKALHRPSPAKA